MTQDTQHADVQHNKVLVAGVGNVFLSDDGFGVEVVQRLTERGGFPPEVELVDIGIRGVHLAYQLLDGYRALVLVDAASQGGPPGTVFVVEHDLNAPGAFGNTGEHLMDAHGMAPDAVLTLLKDLAIGVGAEDPVGRVVVVGCEPANLDEGMGLSPPVAAAVDIAVEKVTEIVSDLLNEKGSDHDEVTVRRSAGGGSGSGADLPAGHREVPGNSRDVTQARR
ncbi:MAG: hydrogenase maturation protease [Pseudonocardiales bacterium]|nr:hydrogenase maturation protease [Pseudonocardiales bacterium]